MNDDKDWQERLAAAGLVVKKGGADPTGFVPPVVAGQMVSCPPGDGRSEAWVDIEDRLLHEKANADWYRLSVEGGLFPESDPSFFIGLAPEEEGPGQWIRVELQTSWDIMGKGASGLLGSAHGRPEFLALSCDGTVLCCGTTSQFSIGTVVVTSPDHSEVLRRFARYVATSEIGHPDERTAARRWLDSNPAHTWNQ
ncbi:hypothetical protein ACGFYQ_31055 [Streptomyces sp. NPDC048258]|uniref:hypothetical protein n=1 Tax=Streptomyces sp. NPDC048258 TaxID=3365527 RepID=UPI003717170C